MKQYSSITPEIVALLERIKQVRNANSVTLRQIADEAKIPVGTVTHQLAGYNNLDVRVLLAVIRLCPDVSADWLLSGRNDISHADARVIIRRLDDIDSKLSSTPFKNNAH